MKGKGLIHWDSGTGMGEGARGQVRWALRWVLAGVLVLAGLVGPARPAQAATFTVNTTADTVDANPGDGNCADSSNNCSLRAAVMEANAQAQVDSSKTFTIVLQAGQTYTLSRDTAAGDDNTAAEDDLDITGNITIQGNGATVQRNPQYSCEPYEQSNPPLKFRIFHVLSGGFLTLDNLTVTRGCADGSGGGILNAGTLTITNSTISGNRAVSSGGGILNTGTLTITGSTISGNEAYQMGGGNSGGGIFNAGTLTITNSTISGNSTGAGDGGGIYNLGTLTITNSTISQNIANYARGGGIVNFHTLTVTDSTISQNSADEGGGIWNSGATVGITNSMLSNNNAGQGGGIYNFFGTVTITNSTISGNGYGDGSGIFNVDTLTIARSTLSGNSAVGTGGGILNAGTLTITNSTLSANSASHGGGVYNSGTVGASFVTVAYNDDYTGLAGGLFNDTDATFNIKNSIVANNTGGPNCSGTLNGLGVNFATDSTCGSGFTQVTSVQLNLQPLADNGGQTKTHALGPGSVAIDAVTDCTDLNNNPVSTDQRGVSRPQGPKCDAGAFEAQGGAPTPTPTPMPTPSPSPGPSPTPTPSPGAQRLFLPFIARQ